MRGPARPPAVRVPTKCVDIVGADDVIVFAYIFTYMSRVSIYLREGVRQVGTNTKDRQVGRKTLDRQVGIRTEDRQTGGQRDSRQTGGQGDRRQTDRWAERQ